MSKISPFLTGILGSALLLGSFFGLLTWVESWSYALGRFLALWWLMLPLVAGFGLQLGLYWRIRQGLYHGAAETASVAASGGVSSGAMVACCLHHATDLLPVLGLSALAPFLVRYQPLFLVIGIMSNLYGISLMLETLKKMGLYQPDRGLIAKLAGLNLRRWRLGLLALSVVVLPVLLLSACSGRAPTAPATPQAISLSPQEDSQGGLTIVVEGRFRPGESLELDVTLDTHAGSLPPDIAKLAILEDSLGNRYSLTEWRGAPLGGHHGKGILVFPPLQGNAEWLRLALQDLYGIPQRTFTWQLK